MLLEAGHLGQTFYLSATQQGLGAFFTCDINEADLDRDLGFDGISQGCIALLGAGWPSDEGAALRLSYYQLSASPG
jgi:nitroreductase